MLVRLGCLLVSFKRLRVLVVVFLGCISLDARLFCLGLIWGCELFGCGFGFPLGVFIVGFEFRLFVCIGLVVFI